MKRYPIIVFVNLGLLFLSCNGERYTKVTIINETNSSLEAINLSNGFDEEVIDFVSSNEILKSKIIFSEKVKYDGIYRIEFKKDGDDLVKNFGYYSNGSPSGAMYEIRIRKDTIIIDEKFE